jgi:hypothetical protein
MEKGKRKGISLLTGPGGILAQLGRARQAAHGMGNEAGTTSWARAHASEGGGGITASGGGGEAVRGGENRSPVKFRGGSLPVV